MQIGLSYVEILSLRSLWLCGKKFPVRMMMKGNEKSNGSSVNFISAMHMTDVGEMEIRVELLR